MATTNGNAGKMPQKIREVNNHHMDSTVWNDVKFRPDDIVIATYSKSGTTVRSNLPQIQEQLLNDAFL